MVGVTLASILTTPGTGVGDGVGDTVGVGDLVEVGVGFLVGVGVTAFVGVVVGVVGISGVGVFVISGVGVGVGDPVFLFRTPIEKAMPPMSKKIANAPIPIRMRRLFVIG